MSISRVLSVRHACQNFLIGTMYIGQGYKTPTCTGLLIPQLKMFWQEEAQIPENTYTTFKEIIWFLRIFGLFPLSVIQKGPKLFLKWSPWYALYSYAFGTFQIFLVYFGLLEDTLPSAQNSIKVVSNTDRYVLVVGISGYCLTVFCGIFIMPFYFLKLFTYVKYTNEIDSMIGTTYVKRDKYMSVLVLFSILAYDGVIILLDYYMAYVLRGEKIGFFGVMKRNLGLDFVVYITLCTEYTNRHMALSLEKRIIRLNELLEKQYNNKIKIPFKDEWKLTRSIIKGPISKISEEKIIHLRHAYLKLMDAMEVLHFFGINTLMALLSSLFLLVVSPYFIILALEGKRRGTIEFIPKFMMFWMHIFRVLLITEPWYSCTMQMERMKGLICKLFCLKKNQQYTKQIRVFSMVVCLRDQKFSACGFFNVDRLLFTSMIGSVTTYLVILLQAQENDTN